MMNPYQSPTTTPSDRRNDDDQRRAVVALVPFAIAAIAVPIAGGAWFWRPIAGDAASVVFGIAGAILIFDLPVCALVVVAWLRTGHAPLLSLSPLIPSREEREFHRRLRTRPRLDDHAFLQVYFADSGIPADLPGKLRRTLEDVFALDFAALNPDELLANADPEMDWADVIVRIERDFQIVFPRDSLTETVTFRSLVTSIGHAIRQETATSRESPT